MGARDGGDAVDVDAPGRALDATGKGAWLRDGGRVVGRGEEVSSSSRRRPSPGVRAYAPSFTAPFASVFACLCHAKYETTVATTATAPSARLLRIVTSTRTPRLPLAAR